jgi:hypothetical protein
MVFWKNVVPSRPELVYSARSPGTCPSHGRPPPPAGHQIPLHDVARPTSLEQLRHNARLPGPPVTGQSFLGTFRSGDLVYGIRESRACYGI